MDRREVLGLLAAILPFAAGPVQAAIPDPSALPKEGAAEKVSLDAFGAKIVAIDEKRKRVIIEGDLNGLRILVTDELGNLVFPKWTYVVEDGRVVITFTSPAGHYYEGQVFLSFIDFRGQPRVVHLTWS